jgi:hypothetical protein
MNYWFINTDESALKDVNTCDLWFKHGLAFSGGDWDKYALPLRNLELRDILFMYHNHLGIVGVGRVLKVWDENPYREKLLYTDFDFSEYRIRVDWYIDIRDNPINPRSEFGYNSSRFLQRIDEQRETAANLVLRLESAREFVSSGELSFTPELQEGNVRTVVVDVHERNTIARKQCIENWGTSCCICNFSFSDVYGPIGDGYIHVHHLDPICTTEGTRPVDPVNDLRPVCPNCHAIIHKKTPPYTIEEVVEFFCNGRNPEG